jgi:hypothetical protein
MLYHQRYEATLRNAFRSATPRAARVIGGTH